MDSRSLMNRSVASLMVTTATGPFTSHSLTSLLACPEQRRRGQSPHHRKSCERTESVWPHRRCFATCARVCSSSTIRHAQANRKLL
jgi:hypothetical protein